MIIVHVVQKKERKKVLSTSNSVNHVGLRADCLGELMHERLRSFWVGKNAYVCVNLSLQKIVSN